MTFLDTELAEMMKRAEQASSTDRRRRDGLQLPHADLSAASVLHFEQAANVARSAWGCVD
jgi:hypothetical protein